MGGEGPRLRPDLRDGGGLPQNASPGWPQRVDMTTTRTTPEQGPVLIRGQPEPVWTRLGQTVGDQSPDERVRSHRSRPRTVHDSGISPCLDSSGTLHDHAVFGNAAHFRFLDVEQPVHRAGDGWRHPVAVHFPIPGHVPQESLPISLGEPLPKLVPMWTQPIHDGPPVPHFRRRHPNLPHDPAQRHFSRLG